MKFDIEDNNIKRKKENNKQQKLLVIASLFFAILSILLIVVYFSTQNKTTNTQKPTSETKKEETKKEEIEEEIEEDKNDRPLAVMIDNEEGNYRHAGLQDSYVNYEMISDNGSTKILALYKDSEVALIGPVTTADHYFLDYAKEHKAVLTSYGMSEYTQKQINDNNYDYIGKEDSKAFMQDKETSSHNIFTSTSRIKEVSKNKNYKTTNTSNEVFKYDEEEVDLQKKENSKKSSYINLKYTVNEIREYKYDSNNKYYLRSNNGEPDIDRSTEEQLHYKNIIIIYIATDTVPRENILDINTVGSGEGYYVTNGYAVPIKWEKQNKKAKTIYRYKNSEEIKLNKGNTFVQIVPGTED